MSIQLPTKPFDIIRALIAAFTAAMTTDAADQQQAAEANSKIGALQRTIDDTNAALSAAKTQLAADDERLTSLGDPLTDDETAHLSALLATQVQQPPVAVAAPVEPVAATPAAAAPVPPVDPAPTAPVSPVVGTGDAAGSPAAAAPDTAQPAPAAETSTAPAESSNASSSQSSSESTAAN